MSNIRLATKALRFARSKIHESSSALSTPESELMRIDQKIISQVRQGFLDAGNSLKLLYRVAAPEAFALKASEKKIKMAKVGNCGEYALLAMHYLYKQNANRIEMMMIQNGDHTFVVLGRLNASDINQPETWGEDAVVCDPWSNLVYPARDIPTNLMCFNGIGGRRIFPREPDIHTLKTVLEFRLSHAPSVEWIMSDAFKKAELAGQALLELRGDEYLGVVESTFHELKELQEGNYSIHDRIQGVRLTTHLNKIISSLVQLTFSAANDGEAHTVLLNHWVNFYLKTAPRSCTLSIDTLHHLDRSVLLNLLRWITPGHLERLAADSTFPFLYSLAGEHAQLERGSINEACFLQLVKTLKPERVAEQYAKCTISISLSGGSKDVKLLTAFAHKKLTDCFDALLTRLPFKAINDFLYQPDIDEIDADKTARKSAIAWLEKHRLVPDVNHASQKGNTLLHRAVRKNAVNTMRSLLNQGANPGVTNRFGVTPLHLAMHYTVNAEILESLLLSNRLDFKRMNARGQTPIDLAMQAFCLQEHHQKLDALIHHRLFDDFPKDSHGRHWLHQTACFPFAPALMHIINAQTSSAWRRRFQAAINEPDIQGNTPLHLAAANGDFQMVDILLLYATEYTHSDSEYSIASSLCNKANLNGETPLHYACKYGHAHLVVPLSTVNNIHMLDRNGKTPLDSARTQGYFHVIERIEDANFVRCLEKYLNERLKIQREYTGWLQLDGLFGGFSRHEKRAAVVKIIDVIRKETYSRETLRLALPKAAQQGFLDTLLKRYFNNEPLEPDWLPVPTLSSHSSPQIRVF